MTSTLKGSRQPLWRRIGPRAAEAVLVVVLAYLLAQTFWFSIYGTDTAALNLRPAAAGAAAGPALRYEAATFAGLFAARGGAEAVAEGPAPESRLNFQLRGVRVEGADTDGVAIIEVPGQGQRLIQVGEEISAGIVLVSVTNTHVIINRRGAREAIYLRDEARRTARAAAAPATSTAPPASAGASDTGGATSSNQLTGAPDPQIAARLETDDWVDGLRLEPVLEGGALQGLRVRGNTHRDVLRASGLLPGDVVRSVNGTRLDGAQAARAVAQTFETAGEARLEIERDGAPVTLTIPLNRGG